jgi:hypothetical protein
MALACGRSRAGGAAIVYRKRKFREIHGRILLDATEKFGRELHEAQSNAPFGSEIYEAIEKPWESIRHVRVTLTGDPEYGWARCTVPATTHPEGSEIQDLGYDPAVEGTGCEEVAFFLRSHNL